MAKFAKKVVRHTVELSEEEFKIILQLLHKTTEAEIPGSYALWDAFDDEEKK